MSTLSWLTSNYANPLAWEPAIEEVSTPEFTIRMGTKFCLSYHPAAKGKPGELVVSVTYVVTHHRHDFSREGSLYIPIPESQFADDEVVFSEKAAEYLSALIDMDSIVEEYQYEAFRQEQEYEDEMALHRLLSA